MFSLFINLFLASSQCVGQRGREGNNFLNFIMMTGPSRGTFLSNSLNKAAAVAAAAEAASGVLGNSVADVLFPSPTLQIDKLFVLF